MAELDALEELEAQSADAIAERIRVEITNTGVLPDIDTEIAGRPQLETYRKEFFSHLRTSGVAEGPEFVNDLTLEQQSQFIQGVRQRLLTLATGSTTFRPPTLRELGFFGSFKKVYSSVIVLLTEGTTGAVSDLRVMQELQAKVGGVLEAKNSAIDQAINSIKLRATEGQAPVDADRADLILRKFFERIDLGSTGEESFLQFERDINANLHEVRLKSTTLQNMVNLAQDEATQRVYNWVSERLTPPTRQLPPDSVMNLSAQGEHPEIRRAFFEMERRGATDELFKVRESIDAFISGEGDAPLTEEEVLSTIETFQRAARVGNINVRSFINVEGEFPRPRAITVTGETGSISRVGAIRAYEDWQRLAQFDPDAFRSKLSRATPEVRTMLVTATRQIEEATGVKVKFPFNAGESYKLPPVSAGRFMQGLGLVSEDTLSRLDNIFHGNLNETLSRVFINDTFASKAVFTDIVYAIANQDMALNDYLLNQEALPQLIGRAGVGLVITATGAAAEGAAVGAAVAGTTGALTGGATSAISWASFGGKVGGVVGASYATSRSVATVAVLLFRGGGIELALEDLAGNGSRWIEAVDEGYQQNGIAGAIEAGARESLAQGHAAFLGDIWRRYKWVRAIVFGAGTGVIAGVGISIAIQLDDDDSPSKPARHTAAERLDIFRGIATALAQADGEFDAACGVPGSLKRRNIGVAADVIALVEGLRSRGDIESNSAFDTGLASAMVASMVNHVDGRSANTLAKSFMRSVMTKDDIAAVPLDDENPNVAILSDRTHVPEVIIARDINMVVTHDIPGELVDQRTGRAIEHPGRGPVQVMRWVSRNALELYPNRNSAGWQLSHFFVDALVINRFTGRSTGYSTAMPVHLPDGRVACDFHLKDDYLPMDPLYVQVTGTALFQSDQSDAKFLVFPISLAKTFLPMSARNRAVEVNFSR